MEERRVKSAVRVIEILEFFASHRRPARMHELCAALRCPPSSMTALLRTMIGMGYVEFDEDTHHYFPAPRISRLTSWLDTGNYEKTGVLDAMCALRDDLGEPVVLAARSDLEIEYVDSLHCQNGLHSHIKKGSTRLMVQNGIGWLMLSRMPPETARAVYRKTVLSGLLQEAEYSETDLAADLVRHRETDVSVVHARDLVKPTAHWNASMVSILLPVPPGHRGLAVGVHGPTSRIQEKATTIADRLRRMVADLGTEIHAH
ncbi:IclR family transcriptional regulator [Arenibacterium halophilum]|uniref:HTH iclR-type domain-containing protein n=1 Tax=Arenibacterium halophilum TaxID=2583821 RepID=A0ABY2X341_9RHOB|nr:helix-turn-helix domain-containing protein [Arenibacterium halophilum]TMV09356.1 hypothetical protein FGK64_19925 [Arenibacterium halophilum]